MPAHAADDTALNERLTHLRQTDPAAFVELLFRSFYGPLRAVAYRVVPDWAVVEDVVQDVFLKLWQDQHTLPAIAAYRPYLTRMALNAALRARARAQRQVAWDEAPPAATAPVAPDALAALHADETAAAIAAALARLPPQCRMVFELSRFDELSYQQIADALNLSPKTVDNQMGKALRLLRRELAGVLRNLYGLLAAALAVKSCWLTGPADARLAPGRAAAPGQLAAAAHFFSAPRGGCPAGTYLLARAAPAPFFLYP